MREEEQGQEVLDLGDPEPLDLGLLLVVVVLGLLDGPLDAAVPRLVLVMAVAVPLAVADVVLLVVRDEVVEREAVVAGDEVDRVVR